MYKILFFLFVSQVAFGQNRMFQSQNGNVKTNPVVSTQIALTLVGGGGGGGGDVGGGGGGGQVVNYSNYNLSSTQTLVVTVAIKTDYPGSYNSPGKDGWNSTVSGGSSGTITALGGNGGRSRNSPGTNTGWNGGGGSYDYNTANAGQGGFAGGNAFSNRSCGGGGGSGGVGQNATITNPGNGGIGVLSNIDGKYYGGGGGGGEYQGTATGLGTHGGGDGGRGNSIYGSDASANTGGGGGGGPSTTNYPNSGRGAAGIVIIQYPGTPNATGGTITQVSGFTVHTFTSSGTFVLN
jgi:hypothetical protein